MDADSLRLILFIAGVALVLGIYFWDRRKRTRGQADEIRRARERSSGLEEGTDWSAGTDAAVDINQELGELDEILVAERAARGAPEEDSASEGEDPLQAVPGQIDFFESLGPDVVVPANTSAEQVPSKIIQINIIARGAFFEGNDILRAAYDAELKLGEMNIFHRYPHGRSSGRALFSMASMVEPGVFPVDEMAAFSCPGLTLFAVLPGPQDGIAIFSDMLFTAERVAALLDGELQDETHSALTKQTIEHLREEILEHRRKIQLLQKAR